MLPRQHILYPAGLLPGCGGFTCVAGKGQKPDVRVVELKEVPLHAEVVLDRALRTRDMDNERFLLKVRRRLDACTPPLTPHISLCFPFLALKGSHILTAQTPKKFGPRIIISQLTPPPGRTQGSIMASHALFRSKFFCILTRL